MVDDLKTFLRTVIKSILINPKSLDSGEKISKIGLNPREVLGLFIICAVGNYLYKADWTVASDPENYDGVVLSKSGHRAGEGFSTEQVYVPDFESGDLTDLVLDRISKKSSKGREYGKNRHLIIFCNKSGLLDYQKIKQSIADNEIFNSFWVIAKHSQNKWNYFVATLKTISDPLMAYEVKILDNFDDWEVKSLGKL